MRAIADHIDESMAEWKMKPLSIEGLSSSQWVVIDLADVVVHIFRRDVREHYALEKLWGDAKRLTIPEQPVKLLPAPSQPKKRVIRRASKGR